VTEDDFNNSLLEEQREAFNRVKKVRNIWWSIILITKSIELSRKVKNKLKKITLLIARKLLITGSR